MPRLRIVVTDRLGHPLRVPGLAAWLTRIAPASARGEVALALVSDRHIRSLNKTYRSKDAATDVLSFPHLAQPPSRSARRRPSPEHPRHLGDVVISTDAARRQAREAGHSYGIELRVLALHGLLHLLGYDHESPSDRGRMARVERRLRAKGGLRGGLIERASTASEPRAGIRLGADGASAGKARRPRGAAARAGEYEGRRPAVEK